MRVFCCFEFDRLCPGGKQSGKPGIRFEPSTTHSRPAGHMGTGWLCGSDVQQTAAVRASCCSGAVATGGFRKSPREPSTRAPSDNAEGGVIWSRGSSSLGFHTFRHTRATLLFRSGWNAVQVQRFLGHSDPGFTLRRYVHLLDDDLPTPQPLGLRNDTERGDAEISAEAMAAAGRR